jgi:hypothetical protein
MTVRDLKMNAQGVERKKSQIHLISIIWSTHENHSMVHPVAAASLSILIEEAKAADQRTLSSEDKKFLDALTQQFLFNPNNKAKRVVVPRTVRTVWTHEVEIESEGWLYSDGGPRIFFTDGASMVAPDQTKIKQIDFAAACKARYTPVPKTKEDSKDEKRFDEMFRKMQRTAIGAQDEDDLTIAAWAYRLGHEETAAKALIAPDGVRSALSSEVANIKTFTQFEEEQAEKLRKEKE